MIFRFLAWLYGRRIVWLLDFEGKQHRTWLKQSPFGPYAPVYPMHDIGHVTLNTDGTTGGYSSYIIRWAYEGKTNDAHG